MHVKGAYDSGMSLFREFRAFAIKGNVIDLAVGVIIGAAFGRIVTSLVNDIVMPILGIITGNVDFSDKSIVLKAATLSSPAVTINYGVFINAILQFLIVGWAVFLIVHTVNRWKRTDPAPEPTTRECPQCFSVINKKAIRCPACTSDLKPA